jgi:hypothetical protein
LTLYRYFEYLKRRPGLGTKILIQTGLQQLRE